MSDQTARVVEETVRAVREELDWATVREAASLAAMASLTFAGWWLCGRGFHSWDSWEFEDETVVDECSSCGRQAVSALAA